MQEKITVMKTLTIGIPFYNNAATLGDAIRSVFAQTFQDWELLLIDDGSTDGSLDIARAIRDPRVVVKSDGVNRGLVFRLNQIAQLASGKYLARMDADDLMLPDRLEKQIRFLTENPDFDLVDCALYSMDLYCKPEGIRGTEPLDARPETALKQALLTHATVVGYTEWFRQNHYDPVFIRAEDYELWCRTCRFTKFGRISEPLYLVREGRVNLRNYLKSCQTCRLLFRTYGPDLVGMFSTVKLIALSRLKGAVYQLFGAFGVHDLLVRRRNKLLSAMDKEKIEKAIRKIIATPVPGTEEHCHASIPAHSR
jgi:glycosyltransferase involved in cell wall biosynthesis